MELVTEQYKLHNRMCEKTVHYKAVRVQNGTFYRTVRVTQRDVGKKRYITKRYVYNMELVTEQY